jgi:hypothetical protein
MREMREHTTRYRRILVGVLAPAGCLAGGLIFMVQQAPQRLAALYRRCTWLPLILRDAAL